MHYLIRIVCIIAIAVLLPAGCGKKAAEPVPITTLMRPVLALDVKAGRVLVPKSLLIERGGVPGVFVISDENMARFRMVRTGKTMNDQVEILSGLSGSETLVAGELLDVHDGSLIQPPRMSEGPEAQEQFSGQNK